MAREGGAQESPEGVLKLQLAEEQLENARALMRHGDQADAERVLVRGQADAEVALAIGHENRTRAESKLAMARTDSVRAKIATGSEAKLRDEASRASVEDHRGADARSSASRDKKAREAMDKIPLMGIGTVRFEDRGTVITVAASTVFLPHTASLSPEARASLDIVADALGAPAIHRVAIQSYTDSEGTPASSRELCDQQAHAVMDYVVSRGVPPAVIRAEGLGAVRPIADNGTMGGRAKNRRIEIVVTEETARAPAP